MAENPSRRAFADGDPVPKVRWMHSKQFWTLLQSGEALEAGRPLKDGTVAIVHDAMPETGIYDAPTETTIKQIIRRHEESAIRYALRNLDS